MALFSSKVLVFVLLMLSHHLPRGSCAPVSGSLGMETTTLTTSFEPISTEVVTEAVTTDVSQDIDGKSGPIEFVTTVSPLVTEEVTTSEPVTEPSRTTLASLIIASTSLSPATMSPSTQSTVSQVSVSTTSNPTSQASSTQSSEQAKPSGGLTSQSPLLSLDPEVNHQITVGKQNDILAFGEKLSLGITNTLISPFVLFNNKVSQAAATLPGLMAANGAVLGSAIATPIQMSSMAANNLAAGITGTLVSIPISLVSGGTAQLIGLLESGRQLYQGSVANMRERIQVNMPNMAQPTAVVSGTKSVVGGIALGALANGVKQIGQGVSVLANSLANTGDSIANAGSSLTSTPPAEVASLSA